MTNVMTGQPLRVLKHPEMQSRLRVPKSQIEAVCQILDQHRINYEVSQLFVSLDGKSETGAINFGWEVDGNVVQSLLDSAP